MIFEGGVDMASELYLMAVGDGRYSILLCDNRSITQMPMMTPAETLIAFSELDYTDYRKAVRWLRDKHPCSRNGSTFL